MQVHKIANQFCFTVDAYQIMRNPLSTFFEVVEDDGEQVNGLNSIFELILQP